MAKHETESDYTQRKLRNFERRISELESPYQVIPKKGTSCDEYMSVREYFPDHDDVSFVWKVEPVCIMLCRQRGTRYEDFPSYNKFLVSTIVDAADLVRLIR